MANPVKNARFEEPASQDLYMIIRINMTFRGPNRLRILMLRGYTLTLAAGLIAFAHLANARRTLRMHA